MSNPIFATKAVTPSEHAPYAVNASSVSRASPRRLNARSAIIISISHALSSSWSLKKRLQSPIIACVAASRTMKVHFRSSRAHSRCMASSSSALRRSLAVASRRCSSDIHAW